MLHFSRPLSHHSSPSLHSCRSDEAEGTRGRIDFSARRDSDGGLFDAQLKQLLADDAVYSRQLVAVALGTRHGLNPRQALSLQAAIIEGEASRVDPFKLAQLAASEQQHLAGWAKACDDYVL
jgi:hypothetical protein